MKLANLFLITALVGVLGAIGCSTDSGNGNGGTGGDGAAGTGGNGVDVCKEGVCANEATAEERCRMFLTACDAGEALPETCAAGGLIICGEFDGAGGTGGGGGTGGAGGAPDPDVVCMGGVCANDDDLEQLCKDAIALCLANNPAENAEECIIGLSKLICESI